jgi:potassium efflux system protein
VKVIPIEMFLRLFPVMICLLSAVGFEHRALAQNEEKPQQKTEPEREPELTLAGITAEEVQSRIAQVEAATDLQETAKTELLGLYRQALNQITAAENWAARVNEFRKGQEEAPKLLEEAKGRLKELTGRSGVAPVLNITPDTTLEQLTQNLADAEAALKARQEEAKQLDDEARNRAERKTAIPDLLAEARKRLETITKDLAAPVAAETSPQAALARRTLLLAQKQAVEQETKAYEEELRFYTARSDVLATKRDKAKLEVAEAQARANAWRSAVSERRQAEAQEQKRQAEEELLQASGPVRELAEENARLAEERAALAAKIDAVAASTKTVRDLHERLGKEFSTYQADVERPEMADYVGPLMRNKRAELRSYRTYEQALHENKREFARVHAELAKIEQQRAELADFEETVAAVVASHLQTGAGIDPNRLEAKVREVLRTKRESLQLLRKDYEEYSDDLTEYGTALESLLARVEEFGGFIDRHVLWMRSTGPIHQMAFPRELPISVTDWRPLGRAVFDDLAANPLAYLVSVLLLIALFGLQPKFRSSLRALGDRTSKALSDRYAFTLHALADTVLLSLPWPFLLWFLAWRLTAMAGGLRNGLYDLTESVGRGLHVAAAFLFALVIARQVCRAKGLSVKHFRWDANAVSVARRYLIAMMFVLTPVVFLVATTEEYSVSVWRESLGRVAFIFGMIALAVISQRMLRPRGGIFTARLQRHRGGWLDDTRYLWYPTAVLAPVVLAGASAAGYHYTAVEFARRLAYTAGFAVLLLLIHALLVRWLFVAQRRLAIEQARKKRAAALEAKAGAPDQVSPPPEIDEAALNLVSIGDQTRKLLRAGVVLFVFFGLWFIWADILPALSFMKDVELWTHTVEEVGAAGGVVTKVEHLTLASVAAAVIVTIVTLVLAKNIPGLLEITLLQRLPLDTGGRFATTSIARYFIIVVGVVIAFGMIGISWSKIQWLVAAITVGLGFGLQEIFANFVSGLMLLFERPIRIGDTVTVSGVTGTVTRIRIRATTVTDWDRKELVIPNKEFITGQVINWTLSDSILRVIIPVGIEYGSDTDLAEELLLKVAGETPHVLEDPKSRVLFMDFADSALNYELRVFVPSIDYLLKVRHLLHKGIDREFRQAGIVIAFPQRDLHLKSTPETESVTLVPKPSSVEIRDAHSGGYSDDDS